MLRVYSVEVPAREKDDLKEEPIVIKLRKVRFRQFTISRSLMGCRRPGVRATTAYNRCTWDGYHTAVIFVSAFSFGSTTAYQKRA